MRGDHRLRHRSLGVTQPHGGGRHLDPHGPREREHAPVLGVDGRAREVLAAFLPEGPARDDVGDAPCAHVPGERRGEFAQHDGHAVGQPRHHRERAGAVERGPHELGAHGAGLVPRATGPGSTATRSSGVPSTGPGKMQRPVLRPALGPQTKQPGKLWRRNPMKAGTASRPARAWGRAAPAGRGAAGFALAHQRVAGEQARDTLGGVEPQRRAERRRRLRRAATGAAEVRREAPAGVAAVAGARRAAEAGTISRCSVDMGSLPSSRCRGR